MSKRIKFIKLHFIVLGFAVIGGMASCNKEPLYTPVSATSTTIYNFLLEKTASNPKVNRTYEGMIVGDSAIHMLVDYGTDITWIEPTIIQYADSMFPKGKQNFTQPVKYTLWANGKSASYTVTIKVSTIQSPVITRISSGSSHVFAIKNDGTVWVCGNNYSGQLGLGDYSSRNTFTQAPIYDADQVFTGEAATIIKLKDGTAWGTGNQYGQLGLGNKNGIASFTRVPMYDNVSQIGITFSEVFILKNDGTVWGAGRNFANILVQGDYDLRASFVKMPIDNVKELRACGNDVLVQKTNGEIWGWGVNSGGELCVSAGTVVKAPTLLPAPPVSIKKLILGGTNIFLQDDAGNIWASGANSSGQLALGDQSTRTSFTQVTFFNNKTIIAVAPHIGGTTFLESNGTVWNVGNNVYGLIGVGTTTTLPYITPTQLPNFNATAIGGNGSNAYALKNDGTLWAWGLNSSGALGTGQDIMYSSTPTQLK